MNWITIILSVVAATCLTLGAVYFLVWLRMRDSREHLLFSAAAIAAAVAGLLELQLMHVRTPEAYGDMIRWLHVPAGIIMVTFVWFIRVYLHSGRKWLAWLITGLRTFVLALNFLVTPNATFREITGIRFVSFLGDSLSAPEGTPNPWRVVIHLSMFLMLVYVVDASLQARRQGERRRPLILGGVVCYVIIHSAVVSALMTKGILPAPFISISFLLVVLAMAFELSFDLAGAEKLSRDLHESQERMSLAARAADLDLWEWDIAHDEVWTTGSGSEPVKATERMNFVRFLESVHVDDREQTREAVQHALDGSDDLTAEYRVMQPDGQIRWIATHGHVERNGNGEPLRMRGVSRNITERKRIDAELQKQRQHLMHVQRVSTLEQLSSSLAHEINQPLGAILRNAEAGELFLRRDPPDLDEIRDILVDIRRDEQRATDMIQHLRSLLKRGELHRESLAIEEQVQQVAAMIGAELQTHHATLRVEIPPELPRVSGDRIHLQQVILNLLLNGLEASDGTPNRHPQLVVRASRPDDDIIEVSVTDCGTGIPADRLSSIFEPFFTTKSSGTGIGLSICRTIVELHGGRIWVENNPDGGATFRFTLHTLERQGVS